MRLPSRGSVAIPWVRPKGLGKALPVRKGGGGWPEHAIGT